MMALLGWFFIFAAAVVSTAALSCAIVSALKRVPGAMPFVGFAGVSTLILWGAAIANTPFTLVMNT